jgi:formylmethanofuran dehydrogenase subunit C
MKVRVIVATLFLGTVPAFAGYQVLQDENGNTVNVTGNALNVTGAFNVSGSTVNVGNFPAVQSVNDNGGSLTVDGAVDVNNFPAVQAVSDNGGSLTVDGSVTNTPQSNNTASVTNASVGSGVAVTLAASNASRLKLIVHNETGTLYVKLGTGASSTSYSYRLTANDRIEVEQYTGDVTAIKASGTTAVLVTEY